MDLRASPTDYLVNSCQLVTSDLDLAREAVGQMWEYHQSRVPRGRRYEIRWHQADFARSTLAFVRSPTNTEVICSQDKGPTRPFRIMLHESGRIRHTIRGGELFSTPRCAAIHSPGEPLEFTTEPFSTLVLSLDGDMVTRAHAQRHQRTLAPDSWPRGIALDTPAGVALRSLCRWTARELERPGAELVTSELAAASLERTLLMLFLDCLDEQHPVEYGMGGQVTDARVRRIEEWLEGHLTEPIGVEDMASVAGISVRSLQVAFRRHRGCSPMQRLLQLRLEAARECFRSADAGTSVTGIAIDFGFFNFGRFAARYRAMFGEPPSDTLARTRRRRG